MEAINTLSRFITTVRSQLHCRQILENYETLHNLKKYKFTEILVDNVIPMFQHIIDKFYKNHSSGQSGTWVQNELKLFLWAVICYMELYRKTLSTMIQDDWKFFSRIFYAKEFNLFEYQARTLLDQSVRSAKWKDKQDILLYNIIMSDKKAKWNQIAKQLYMSSNKVYLRTSKQCRERWLNHLDPTKTKSDWDLNQYLILFENVNAKGKKWALIVKLLQDRRSQHTIKNKYNSIMRKKLKINPQLNEEKACEELVLKIHRIIQTYHLDPNDQYLFGPASKLLNSENRHKNKLNRSKNQIEGSQNRIDIFRKKIQKFSSDKTNEFRVSSNKKITKSFCFSKQKKICILPLGQNIENERTINKETQEEDEIFYEQSFEANDLLRGQDNNMIFNEDFKDLIKQHELDA